MRKPGWTPSIVPYGADETIYLVVDNSGPPGSVCREAAIERTEIESVVADLLSGQFNDPIRIVAFNTLEHWSDDMSAEVARELQTRCDIEGDGVPDHLQDFVERHQNHGRQLTLWLA
jgi:hypothetical protein